MKSIKSMSLKELMAMKAKIEIAIHDSMMDTHRDLITAIGRLESRTVAGKPGRKAVDGRHALKGRKIAPKYRNPQNRQETWAGRGNMPRWLTAAIKGGKKLESFSIR